MSYYYWYDNDNNNYEPEYDQDNVEEDVTVQPTVENMSILSKVLSVTRDNSVRNQEIPNSPSSDSSIIERNNDRPDVLSIGELQFKKHMTVPGNISNIESYYDVTTHFNRTVTNEVFSERLYTEWLVSEVFSYVLLAFNCYIIFSLIVYYTLKRDVKTRGSYFFSNKRGWRYTLALNVLTMLSAIFTALRIILNLDTIWGRSSRLACLHLKRPKIFMGFLVYLTVYINFWLRQRIFYSSPQLKHISCGKTRFVSKWVLLLLVLSYLANMLYFMCSDSNFRALPPNGCSVSSDYIPWYILCGNTVVMQTILLALLVYPILNRNNAAQGNKPNLIIRFVIKVSIAAFFAVFCCVTSLLILVFVQTSVDEMSFFIVDVNLTILVVTVLIMFTDWRVRLFPFLKLSKTTAAFK